MSTEFNEAAVSAEFKAWLVASKHKLKIWPTDEYIAQLGYLARARHDHEEMERLREALDWQPIETAPKDMTQVLVSYICGKRRMVAHAQYTPRYTEENINSDCSEYCEEKDNYYTPEGWYEICAAWDDYSSMKMHYEPTHWMPLPEPPNEALARKEPTSGTE